MHNIAQADIQLNKQLVVVAYADSTLECCLLQQKLVSPLPDEHSQVCKVLNLHNNGLGTSNLA